MWHHLIFGILIGWGAAIPVGPVNIEVVRRNLRYGSKYGINFGLGACGADLTYFILLIVGVLAFLQNPSLLRVIGLGGSFMLIWFGITAFRMPVKKESSSNGQNNLKAWHHYFQGYLMTLLNPYTILFWASISAQFASMAHDSKSNMMAAGGGVMMGTISWVLTINIILHFTRHRLSEKTMRYLNYIGGIIILAFAAFGLWHAMHG